MSYRNRPHNWYDMGYEAQRAWEKDQRKIEDSEYEAERAREDAERAAASAARQRRECEAERQRHQYSLDDAHTDLENANEEIARLEAENAELVTSLEAAAVALAQDQPITRDRHGTRLVTAAAEVAINMVNAALAKARNAKPS